MSHKNKHQAFGDAVNSFAAIKDLVPESQGTVDDPESQGEEIVAQATVDGSEVLETDPEVLGPETDPEVPPTPRLWKLGPWIPRPPKKEAKRRPRDRRNRYPRAP